MSVARITLAGVQIEGNLLAADITAELLAGNIKGQAPEDFGFTKTDKLADEIAIAWGDAKAYWVAFQRQLDRLDADDTATSVTRELWVVPLLRSLGYNPVYTAKAEVVEGQTYAISHRAELGENKPPIHIIGCRIKVDHRPPSGTPRLSAHALVQEYLNKTEHLWAIATNGFRWRLLRDSSLMTRLTYVEFDLEQILNGENFAEFGLFYRLFHRSRLPEGMDDADKCLLEYYHQEALQQGGRVRDRLRDGVEKALIQLGTGFLQHPSNENLRQKLAAGTELTDIGYYRQLLRLIYRLLFLMVAESRNLLIGEDVEKARIYREYYSIERLRELAERPHWRREGFQDLWQGLRVTFLLFDENWRGKYLGLSPLNGDLFGSYTLPALDDCAIDNHDLLVAIRELSLYQNKGQLRRVNYAALDVEELGSVYESLLDFHPEISPKNYEFKLVFGSERKTTGSYYTPPQLVGQLIKTALEPVIEEKLRSTKEKLRNAESNYELEKALLDLKIVDPACGSGHFLLAAARRVGKELAKIRTGEAEPGSEPLKLAIRDVIQNCIYGVDLNPLAVDLCKVALWIEGFSRGFPLNFLDHRIKCGNSLVGVMDLSCLNEGIPDEAFKPVTGDDKKLSTQLKKRNKNERDKAGQLSIGEKLETDSVDYAEMWRQLGVIPETTPQQVKDKQKQYKENLQEPSWWLKYSACNLWTAAFFMSLTEHHLQLLPTTEALNRLKREKVEKNRKSEDNYELRITNYELNKVVDAANKLSEEKHFFHWCLEFPEVFEQGGFNCVLGNPPWERIKLQEKEFFTSKSAEIANAVNKAAREKLIKELPNKNPELAQAFEDAKHDAEAQGKFIRESGRFPLTAVGDINTYAIFAETTRKLISSDGRVGVIVPTGIATDDTCKMFFGDLTQKQALASLYDFENREALFTAVHRSYKFSLLAMSGKPIKQSKFAFFITQPKQLDNQSRLFQLSPQDIALINPNTLTCPIFRTSQDAELTKKIYQRFPVLENETQSKNTWNTFYMRLVDLGDHSENIRFPWQEKEENCDIPLYEAKLIWLYDHRFATFEGLPQLDLIDGKAKAVNDKDKSNQDFKLVHRYHLQRSFAESLFDKYSEYTHKWLLVWRDITGATNERTCVTTIIPKFLASRSLPALGFTSRSNPCLLIANLNSLLIDYITRQKIGGNHLTYTILKQLPVLPQRNISRVEE
ncbi:MAG: DNA methyltransferase [Nostoc sp. DedQUE08]|uniref:Eco57I restriction-modification methylase domain-containing protein n=1 Tax=Nostoc sp. DedQUE08 TaxID=3075393 RepID=UPI002AD34164|nr:DNA methyltransferase [Nostoc sp. DedQUE08]MDZ8069448.1 DNA methyltransferase [Nostoc sp. DedQUE08]